MTVHGTPSLMLTAKQIVALFGRSGIEETFTVTSLGFSDRPARIVVHYSDRSMVVDEDGTVSSYSPALEAS